LANQTFQWLLLIFLLWGNRRFQRPYVALTSHAQLLSVHCAVITDGRYTLWIKKEA
jgi:hypothetical protein